MSSAFLLLGSDFAFPGQATGTRHYCQQTGFSCGAACVSMLTGLPEVEARKLARTTRSGTFTCNVVPALEAAGFVAHDVRLSGPLEDHLPELVIQSQRWPLYLHLSFVHAGKDRAGRTRKYTRHHACVLAEGRFLDPGEFHDLDPEALGHLHQKGIFLHSYVLVETKNQIQK